MCRIQRHNLRHFLDVMHAQRRSLHTGDDVTDLIGVCPCATASFRIAPQRCSLPLDTVAMINRSDPGNFRRNV